jgi:branched-chain amino acid transport system ATP-binding protein
MHFRSPRPELLELELLATTVTARPRRGPDAVLTVDDLDVRYGRQRVVRDTSLHVRRGEIVALVGHNGSGKTSTLRAIVGLTPPDRGVVEVAEGNAMRYVPTDRPVFADLLVRENLLLGAGRAAPAVRLARTDAVLDLFPELRPHLSRRAGVLSGGEQRLVAFAIALMGAPSLLLVDEPTQFLGPTATRRVLEALRRLSADEGIAVLMAETNIAAVARVADRVYVVTNGAVCAEHSGDSLRGNDPRSWWRLLDQGPSMESR